jgi:hypothetical protein
MCLFKFDTYNRSLLKVSLVVYSLVKLQAETGLAEVFEKSDLTNFPHTCGQFIWDVVQVQI